MTVLLIAFFCALIVASFSLAIRARNKRNAHAAAIADPFWERDLDDLDWEREDPSESPKLPRYRTPLV